MTVNVGQYPQKYITYTKICYTEMRISPQGVSMYYCTKHYMRHDGTCEECSPSPAQIRDRHLVRIIWSGAMITILLSLTVVGTRW